MMYSQLELERLLRDTDLASSDAQMRDSKSYKRLVAEGQNVLPFLMRSLAHGHPATVQIMLLLRDITGHDPVTPADRGDTDKMARDWLNWGNENGISQSSQ